MELGFLIHNLKIEGEVVLRWVNEDGEYESCDDNWYSDSDCIQSEAFRSEIICLYPILQRCGDLATCIEVRY